jgi:hypothetical protein
LSSGVDPARAGWKIGRFGLQEATVNTGPAEVAPFSLIRGAELQPGLYKLRLWATCSAPWVRNLQVSVALFKKPRPTSTCVPSPLMISHTGNAE